MAAFGKTRISAESDHAVNTFWKFAVYCAETIIFLLAGVLVATKVIMVYFNFYCTDQFRT